jgi:hypothetical protein
MNQMECLEYIRQNPMCTVPDYVDSCNPPTWERTNLRTNFATKCKALEKARLIEKVREGKVVRWRPL